MKLFSRKKTLNNPSVDTCERVIGIVLTTRKDLISFSGVAGENVYAGVIIGKAYARDIEKLNDEFDALALSYTWKVLERLGTTRNIFNKGLARVLRNFDITANLADFYNARVSEYNKPENNTGERLLNNIATIYSGEVKRDDPKLLDKQLRDFLTLLERNITNEISS